MLERRLDTAGDFDLREDAQGVFLIRCNVCGHQVGGGLWSQVSLFWSLMTDKKSPTHAVECLPRTPLRSVP
jgi:hypothetical protein